MLIDSELRIVEFPASDADPRKWQPFDPADPDYRPLTYKICARLHLSKDIQPGWYVVGLWMPDDAKRLRLDFRYAVRVANRDVPWWTDDDGCYGVNILGVIEVR